MLAQETRSEVKEIVAEPATAPPRPPEWQEATGLFLLNALGPRLRRQGPLATPLELAPFEELLIRRRRRAGSLSATWYPSRGTARGAVLLAHPWMPWGQAYFHRRGRITALREAGYHALTVDLPGFGASDPAAGFYDRDLEDALGHLEARCPTLPLHLWGVSYGGYWSHPVLSRTDRVAGAMFEDVSPHILEWSSRTAPWGAPFYNLFRHGIRRAYRFLDMRRHASAFRLRAVSYVSGGRDRGVTPDDTRTLARLADGRSHIVEEAPHLGSIKRAADAVIGLALETFRWADRRAPLGETGAGRGAAFLDAVR